MGMPEHLAKMWQAVKNLPEDEEKEREEKRDTRAKEEEDERVCDIMKKQQGKCDRDKINEGMCDKENHDKPARTDDGPHCIPHCPNARTDDGPHCIHVTDKFRNPGTHASHKSSNTGPYHVRRSQSVLQLMHGLRNHRNMWRHQLLPTWKRWLSEEAQLGW